MTRAYSFFVPGIPQPQGSSRAFVVNGRARITSANPKLKSWRVDVGTVAQCHVPEQFIGPVFVDVEFVFPRPKGHYGTGRNCHVLKPTAPKRHTSKPDVDKLLRGCLDALTGIAWRDDSQVSGVLVSKWYGEQPGTRIRVSGQEATE